MSRFAAALEQHPAPLALGDVRLRYEPSLLIAQTQRPLRSWVPSAALLVGLTALLVVLALFLVDAGVWLIVPVMGLASLGLFGSTLLDRWSKRRRAFVLNFETNRLRLDFVTPFAGRPRTVVVPFGQVRGVDLREQVDHQHALTVDFAPEPTSPHLLREVLVAHVPSAQLEEAERLRRVLHGAFGLGDPPADSPAFQPDGFEGG